MTVYCYRFVNKSLRITQTGGVSLVFSAIHGNDRLIFNQLLLFDQKRLSISFF